MVVRSLIKSSAGGTNCRERPQLGQGQRHVPWAQTLTSTHVSSQRQKSRFADRELHVAGCHQAPAKVFPGNTEPGWRDDRDMSYRSE